MKSTEQTHGRVVLPFNNQNYVCVFKIYRTQLTVVYTNIRDAVFLNVRVLCRIYKNENIQ